MTDGEPEGSLQKIKSIKNPIKHFIIFYFIKSETSDSFVNHFDGHFAYLNSARHGTSDARVETNTQNKPKK